MSIVTAQRDKIKGEEGYIFLDDGGTGGIPVLFTHSFGGGLSHWTNQLSYLRTTRRAIAFDFRGHGGSDASEKSRYTTEALANDIVSVADGLDLEKFILVGHSMGGSAAVAYTDSHQRRVAGLVLVGTPGKTPAEISTTVVASLESDNYQKVMDEYMERLLANATPDVSRKVKEGVNKLSRETSVNIIRSAFEYDPIDQLNRYPGPRLIIQTSNERNQPNSLHHWVPGIPERTIEGTSHWPQMDKPELFNKILSDFLRDLKS